MSEEIKGTHHQNEDIFLSQICDWSSIANYREQTEGSQVLQATLYLLQFCHLKISLGASTWAAFRSKPSEEPLLCWFIRAWREKKKKKGSIFVHFKDAFYYPSSVKGSSIKEI